MTRRGDQQSLEKGAKKLTQRIVVTGANRGLGLEFVKQYIAAGAEVVATARKPQEANDLQESGAHVFELDVASEQSMKAFAAAMARRALDLVVSNAGTYGPREAQNDENIDFDAWLNVLAINTLGPMRVAQALKPSLLAGREPKLINITSLMGSIADTSGGHYAYRSSKSALNSAMAALAKDWAADRIAVAVLHPGWVQTDMGGAQAPLQPPESVRGMRQLIDGLALEQSGQFFNYDGKSLPW